MKKTMMSTLLFCSSAGICLVLFSGCGNSPSGAAPGSARTAILAEATPAAPTGLNGVSSQSKIALNWAALPGAVSYNVYREGIFISAVQTTSFLDTGLDASTTYCYAVSALDAAVNESPASAPACVTTLALIDAVAPAVLSTSPANQAIEVQTDPPTIKAVFSEAMNALSVTYPTAFTIYGVPGTVTYDATTNTATFTPAAALASGTTFTVTISRNVADVAGNLMGTDYVWSFTTTTAPVMTSPAVAATGPANGETAVPVNVVMTAVFSEPMDPVSIMFPVNFIVTPDVPGLVSYDIATMTATFTSSALLTPATVYTCTITTGVKDLAGNQMASDYTWSFMTAP